MKLKHTKLDDNPDLTAYALGELDDPKLVAVIEEQLKSDENARQIVQETRAAAQLLAQEMAAEPSPTLTDDQRHLIESGPGGATGTRHYGAASPLAMIRGREFWMGAGMTAAAACLTFAALWPSGLLGNNGWFSNGAARLELALADPSLDQASDGTPTKQGPGRSGGEQRTTERKESFADAGAAPAENEPAQENTPISEQLASIEVAGSPGADAARMRSEALGQPTADLEAFGKSATKAGIEGLKDQVGRRLDKAATATVAENPAAMPSAGLVVGGLAPVGGDTSTADLLQTPAYAQEKAENTLRANGLGGTERDSRVPLLGDIPLMGERFAETAAGQSTGGEYGGGEYGRGSREAPVQDEFRRPSWSSRRKPSEQSPGAPGRALRRGEGRADNALGLAFTGAPELDLSGILGRRTLENSLIDTSMLAGVGDEELDSEELRDLIERINLANEDYAPIQDNPFLPVVEAPQSTFSIDVDTASYSNIRRYLTANGQLPPPDAVRIEEMINYFSYDYQPPAADAADPFSVNVEIADAPWDPDHRLVRIGLKGKEIAANDRPATNLVFLLDVSGSMRPSNKLPLLKQGMSTLVQNLTVDDRVAIVTYAGDSQVVLDSTSCFYRSEILAAIESLGAGGSTNGGAGISQAYDIAVRNFIEGGANRVILATDGDFNVGTTGMAELQKLIEEKAGTGVFLNVLGFGMGNVKDDTLELLADKGNGVYAYIDNYDEAKKVLVDEMSGTLVTIAKDVKLQIEFNPARVAAYRLIGYENRIMAARDFNDDTKDAGEIGAGHTVTALYEIVPAAREEEVARQVDDLIYQRPALTDRALESGEMFTLNLRYKQPDGDVSKKLTFPVRDVGLTLEEASDDFRFAAAVASFGMILRNSPYKGRSSIPGVLELVEGAAGRAADDVDAYGYRVEFRDLVRTAGKILGAAVQEQEKVNDQE